MLDIRVEKPKTQVNNKAKRKTLKDSKQSGLLSFYQVNRLVAIR